MLTKYIFEIECEHLSERKQHILFSILSDELIDKGCSSISNICVKEEFIRKNYCWFKAESGTRYISLGNWYGLGQYLLSG